MLFSSRVTVRVKARSSVWLVSGYAHVVILYFALSLSLCLIKTQLLTNDKKDDNKVV